MQPREWLEAGRLEASNQTQHEHIIVVTLCQSKSRVKSVSDLQRSEEFVEFVGGVEVGFEVAGAEAFAKVVESAGEEVE